MRRRSHIDAELGSQANIDSLIALLDSPQARQRALKLDVEIDVCRAVWAGRDVVVKCYKHVGLIHSIRHTLKRSRARRAWLNAQRLTELGIRTPRPLAYVDEYRGPLLWRSFLATEFEAGCRLDDLLGDDCVSKGTKRRIVSQVLRLIDRLAKHGISHGDMKHTNILCNGSRVILTDLDGMHVHSLGWLRRVRQYRDISRFLRGLSRNLPVSGDTLPSFVRIASRNACLDINSQFRDGTFEQAMLNEPGRLGGNRVVSSDGSCVWRLETSLGSTPKHIYLKEYVARSWLDRIKHLVRTNRARRAMKGSLLLARCGLRTPEVVAICTLKQRCFMATIEVPDAHPAHEYFREGCESYAFSTLRDRRQLLRQLGCEIGRMHRAGIVHGDLRPGNILVKKRGHSTFSTPLSSLAEKVECPLFPHWEFFFIDNERTRKWPRIPRRLRLKNLVQLNMLPEVSHTDRWRFFHAYMVSNPAVRLRYRWWAGAAITRTRRRWARRGICGLILL